VDAGSIDDLQNAGYLTTKVGSQPVCVFWHEDRAYGIDDRCPHLGFPLHRGTVENGLVTCHWHHARFDLCSGSTLDPFADDARAYDVEIVDGRVVVVADERLFDREAALRRIDDGLEQGLTLVLAKAVLGLLSEGVPVSEIVRAGARFGCRFRAQGFGSGLTVLCAMANVLERLSSDDRPLALVHGLRFLSDDTRGRAPMFPLAPLSDKEVPFDRLTSWYRRFIDTRSGDAAERTLATAIAGGLSTRALSEMMSAAVTDHVFLDEGHILDFTNKAFELVDHLSPIEPSAVALVLPTLVHETADAARHEEEGSWRHPYDLAGLATSSAERLSAELATCNWTPEGGVGAAQFEEDGAVGALGWEVLGEDPAAVVEALFRAIRCGASAEQLGRAVAFAAALRVTRFHVQNDHGDWDVVHHGFTSANALHQLLVRAPSPLLLRGVFHLALKVFLDRFLNVPAARLPKEPDGDIGLEALPGCWDIEGEVDRAGSIVYGHLRSGGRREEVAAALGSALLREDAGFHWFQIYEASVRQAFSWPEGSEESALVLAGAARFLAAHTPTRRELSQVVRIAGRLRRGEALYAEDGDEDFASVGEDAATVS
jgi:nitrite reductase/ring-hydroxylating ferredoxin subunit